MAANAKAKESAQVKKARRKLKAQIEAEQEKFDDAALRKTKAAMQRWISRNSAERVKLEDKSISLFDENRHPAKTQSKFVNALFHEIKHEAVDDEPENLHGRIHQPEDL